MSGIIKRGFMSGLALTWTLGKIIFPVTVIIMIISHTKLFPIIIDWISPFMKLLGLSGEAAVPLVMANFLNLYAGIGAILTFGFTVKEVFIMAIMMSFSHNLIIEGTLASKVGVNFWVITGVRVLLAVFSAILINVFWDGGAEMAQYGLIPAETAAPETWGAIIFTALKTATVGVFQLALIVIPLMIVMQWLRERNYFDFLSKKLEPFTKVLGVERNASMVLVFGLTIGLAYSAGLMIQSAKEDGVSKKDMYLVLIFLVSCHAVIEDTLVFAPLGIPLWPLLAIRLITALLLTALIGVIWNKVEVSKRKEPTNEHSYNSL
ncbi:nucleoside recognition domain-containing protein [Salirhabdus salicampi]|uniref:nucleoside recognition domain-containing protein n=1 Tax=Salirhabdus salicampi TaxID=476102 RepID=UPI0020C1BA27|nr:nucleoside recognition domain-containing protein [Salirhabdus salicampi]MCP8617632.1 nucleoside recognition domain-containing protein [Salirhabdus salicampi]